MIQLLYINRHLKTSILMTLDIFICFISMIFAFYIRLGYFPDLQTNHVLVTLISVFLIIPLFWFFNLYKELLRFMNWTIIKILSKTFLFYLFTFFLLISTLQLSHIPRTIGILQPLLLIMLVFLSRILAAYFIQFSLQKRGYENNNLKSLIYGAGIAGKKLLTLLENSGFPIIGFIDDDSKLQDRSISGLNIFNPKDLKNVISNFEINNIFVAIPSANKDQRNKIIDKILKFSVSVKILPSMNDILDGNIKLSDLKNLQIEDILARNPVLPDTELMKKNITSKTILVTGSGGSIGSEVSRQILKLKPKKLILFDVSEFSLYKILEEVKFFERENIKIFPILGSITDKSLIEKIFKKFKPNIVFHAAAYKHVSIVEHNIIQGLNNNFWGTVNLVKACAKFQTPNFIMISTDKAVRPTNIMGASKRMAEIFVQAFNKEQKKQKKTIFSIVRFGNVLGSSGSVVPKFKKQILNGGPVTITDLNMTRYFMTIQEASQLVIQSAALAKGGEVFLLDMGNPVKIEELAKNMIKLLGFKLKDKNNPTGDIEISETGLQPGEKLYEELLIENYSQKTLHPKIMVNYEKHIPLKELEKIMLALNDAQKSNNLEDVLFIIKNIVEGYIPFEKIVDYTNN